MYIKFNTKIQSTGFVLLQKNARVIVEKKGKVIFGKNIVIKESTIVYAKENSKIIFGNNTSTGHHTEISANNSIEIGNDVIMGAYTYITDSNHSYENENLPIRKQPMNIGKVKIKNNIWIGRNVMLLKDCEIGSNSIVGAGSIVSEKFDDNLVIGGNPASIIKVKE